MYHKIIISPKYLLMKHYNLKVQIGFFLLALSSASFSDTGTVHHKIINNTPYELYVGVRQQFQYPLESCLGPIASGETKECEGPFEKVDAKFAVELIKKSNPAEELRGTVSVKSSMYQNMLLTWTLMLDKQNDLDALVKIENNTLKWINQAAIRQ